MIYSLVCDGRFPTYTEQGGVVNGSAKIVYGQRFWNVQTARMAFILAFEVEILCNNSNFFSLFNSQYS